MRNGREREERWEMGQSVEREDGEKIILPPFLSCFNPCMCQYVHYGYIAVFRKYFKNFDT